MVYKWTDFVSDFVGKILLKKQSSARGLSFVGKQIWLA